MPLYLIANLDGLQFEIKPDTASTSIIPSTPRFNTPDFSHQIGGVPARSLSLMIKLMVWMFMTYDYR